MELVEAVHGKLGPQQFFLSSSSAQVHSGTNESKMELVEAWFISSSSPLLLAQVNGFYRTLLQALSCFVGCNWLVA